MKKSLYIFLCSLLGVLMFVTLQRSLIFIYVVIGDARLDMQVAYDQFLVFNAVSVLLFGFVGGWYGTSLGIHWYKIVYEEKQHGGFINSLARQLFRVANTESKQRLVPGVKRAAPSVATSSTSARTKTVKVKRTLEPIQEMEENSGLDALFEEKPKTKAKTATKRRKVVIHS